MERIVRAIAMSGVGVTVCNDLVGIELWFKNFKKFNTVVS